MAVFQQFVKPYRQPLVRCTVPAGRTVVHPAVVYIDAGDNAVAERPVLWIALPHVIGYGVTVQSRRLHCA